MATALETFMMYIYVIQANNNMGLMTRLMTYMYAIRIVKGLVCIDIFVNFKPVTN